MSSSPTNEEKKRRATIAPQSSADRKPQDITATIGKVKRKSVSVAKLLSVGQKKTPATQQQPSSPPGGSSSPTLEERKKLGESTIALERKDSQVMQSSDGVVPTDDQNFVDEDGERYSQGRKMFVHGLGACPAPPDGELPYFKAVAYFPDLDTTFHEAQDAALLYEQFCEKVYSSRTDEISTALEWNDAFQEFADLPYSTWQYPQQWSNMNSLNKKFYTAVSKRGMNVAKAYLSTPKVAQVGEFVTKKGSQRGTFENVKSGLFVRIWHSATQCRRYVSAIKRLWQVRWECPGIQSVYAPHCAVMSYRGVLVTVTAAVPLLSGPFSFVDETTASPVISSQCEALKAALCIPASFKLPLRRGGDGRFYCCSGIDGLLSLSVAPPEKETGFSVRYEALQYVHPYISDGSGEREDPVEMSLRHNEPLDNAFGEQVMSFSSTGVLSSPSFASSPLADHRKSLKSMYQRKLTNASSSPIIDRKGSVATRPDPQSFLPKPLLSPDKVLEVLLDVAIPLAVHDFLVESLCRRPTLNGVVIEESGKQLLFANFIPDAPPKAQDILKDLLISRIMKRHGVNMRFLANLMLILGEKDRVLSMLDSSVIAHHGQHVVLKTAEVLRTVVVMEMLKRTLKCIVRGLLYTHNTDTEEMAANRANWILALCGSATNGVWRNHVFSFMRVKFNTPKTFIVGYNEGLISLTASYLQNKLGIVYDPKERRFMGLRPITYTLGANSSLPQPPFREVVERFVVDHNIYEEELNAQRLAAAAISSTIIGKTSKSDETENLQKFAVVKAAQLFKKKGSHGAMEDVQESKPTTETTTAVLNMDDAGGLATKTQELCFYSTLNIESRLRFLMLQIDKCLKTQRTQASSSKRRDSTAGEQKDSGMHHLLPSCQSAAWLRSLHGSVHLLRLTGALALLMPYTAGPRFTRMKSSFLAAKRVGLDGEVLEDEEERWRKRCPDAISGGEILNYHGMSDDDFQRLLQAMDAITGQTATFLSNLTTFFPPESARFTFHSSSVLDLQQAVRRVGFLLPPQFPLPPRISSSFDVLLESHISSLQQVNQMNSHYYAAMRYRKLGLEMFNGEMVFESSNRLLRVPSAELGMFRLLFGVTIEAVTIISDDPKTVSHQVQLLQQAVLLMLEYADARDAVYRRRQCISMLRRSTSAIVSSYNPLSSYHMRSVCELSVQWHIARFGFDNVQTSVSICHLIFVSLFTHLPELDHQQEDRLNDFRRISLGLGSLTTTQLTDLFLSQDFLDLLCEMVSVMSDVQDWETGEFIINEAERFQGGSATRNIPESEVSNAEGAEGSAAAPDLVSVSNTSINRSFIAPHQGRENPLLSDDNEEDDLDDILLAGSVMRTANGEQISKARSVGEALVDIVRRQVRIDKRLRLNKLQLVEMGTRQQLESKYLPLLFNDYMDEVVEREALLRPRIDAQEGQERIRCPGCMQAHIWMLTVASNHKQKMQTEEAHKAEVQKKRLKEKAANESMLLQWKSTKETLLKDVQKEHELWLLAVKLKTAEGFERRQVLELERFAFKGIMDLGLRHRSAIGREEVLLQLLDDDIESTNDMLQQLLHRKTESILTKESSYRQAIIENEERLFGALMSRSTTGYMLVCRADWEEEASQEKRNAISDAISKAENSRAKHDLEKLDELERKFDIAEQTRRNRRQLLLDREQQELEKTFDFMDRKIAAFFTQEQRSRTQIIRNSKIPFDVIVDREKRHRELIEVVVYAHSANNSSLILSSDDEEEGSPAQRSREERQIAKEKQLEEREEKFLNTHRRRNADKDSNHDSIDDATLVKHLTMISKVEAREEVQRCRICRDEKKLLGILAGKERHHHEVVSASEHANVIDGPSSPHNSSSPRSVNFDEVLQRDLSGQYSTTHEKNSAIRTLNEKLLKDMDAERLEEKRQLLEVRMQSLLSTEESRRSIMLREQEAIFLEFIAPMASASLSRAKRNLEGPVDFNHIYDDDEFEVIEENLSEEKLHHTNEEGVYLLELTHTEQELERIDEKFERRMKAIREREVLMELKIQRALKIRLEKEEARKKKQEFEAAVQEKLTYQKVESLLSKEKKERANIMFLQERKREQLQTKLSRLRSLDVAENSAAFETIEMNERKRRAGEKLRQVLISAKAVEEMRKMDGVKRMRADAQRIKQQLAAEELAKDAELSLIRAVQDLQQKELSARKIILSDENIQFKHLMGAWNKGNTLIASEEVSLADRLAHERSVRKRREQEKKEKEALAEERRLVAQEKLRAANKQREEKERMWKEADEFNKAQEAKALEEEKRREEMRSKTVSQIMTILAQRKADTVQRKLANHLRRKQQSKLNTSSSKKRDAAELLSELGGSDFEDNDEEDELEEVRPRTTELPPLQVHPSSPLAKSAKNPLE